MLKLKWFSIFRLCCLILFSLFDFPTTAEDMPTMPPAMKRFKFLAQKMSQHMDSVAGSGTSSNSDCQAQLSKYLCEVEDHSLTTSATSNTLDFWIQREHVYDKLSLVAEDILAAPASQAYVERVFSVCGLLTAGRRNRMSKSLQMRACLKLNRRVLASTDFNTTAWKYKTCSCVIM